MTRTGLAIIAALLLAGASVGLAQGTPAQTAAPATVAPAVSQVDALRLDNAVLTVELAQLRLAQAQAEAQALARSLGKPGFALTRDARGQWIYVAQQPAEKPQEKK